MNNIYNIIIVIIIIVIIYVRYYHVVWYPAASSSRSSAPTADGLDRSMAPSVVRVGSPWARAPGALTPSLAQCSPDRSQSGSAGHFRSMKIKGS